MHGSASHANLHYRSALFPPNFVPLNATEPQSGRGDDVREMSAFGDTQFAFFLRRFCQVLHHFGGSRSSEVDTPTDASQAAACGRRAKRGTSEATIVRTTNRSREKKNLTLGEGERASAVMLLGRRVIVVMR